MAAAVPGASIAAEPDSSQEGIAAPEQVPNLEIDNPGFDPGGDTQLPYDGDPAPPEASPEEGPLESEPADDPEGRSAPYAAPETPAPTGPDTTPSDPSLEPLPSPPAVLPEPPSGGAPPETAPAPAAPQQSLPPERGSQLSHRRRIWTVVAPTEHTSRQRTVTLPISAPPGSTGHLESSANTSVVAEVKEANADASRSGGTHERIHVVRAGESLWVIAEDLLGPDASATKIAAEVARLWELNSDNIPSGDPDVIAVGQHLRLR